jgi:CheY-like chemotaxis protein
VLPRPLRGRYAGTSSQQLLAVIDQVLDLSKIEAGRLELDEIPFRPDGAIQTAIDLVAAAAEEKGLALRREIGPGLPAVVRGDPLRMGQVLTKLVGNAVKFTERGEVAVLVDVVQRDEAQVKVRVRVRDTGIGMTAAERDKLFMAFVQADGSTTRQDGGTGLGLAISKRLVEQMGGELSVESTAGVGSTFTFVVPLSVAAQDEAVEAPGREAAAEALLEPPPDTTLSGARILLVEDNSINQQVGQAILEAAGAEVEIAANGQEATRAVAERGERFAAVIMDVQMPGMDGYAATRAIRRDPRGARIPIIAMTGHAFESERQRCEEAGMNDFIPKPMDPDQLVAVIARWRDRAAAPGFGPQGA